MWNRAKEDESVQKSTSTSSAVANDESPARNLKPSANEPQLRYARSGLAFIGKSVTVKGEVNSHEDLTIEGEIDGRIEVLEHCLTVGPTAKIMAGVKAREVVVLGTICGNVEASDKIDIRKDAKLVGDIRTKRIVIEDGAYFKGSIDIVGDLRLTDRSVLEDRYAMLVEKKYLNGQLSTSDEAEMKSLAAQLSAADSDFYDPILRRLRKNEALPLEAKMRSK